MDETKDTLKPTLSEKVKGIVWKILVNEKKHLAAVESRDADNKQVCFSVFDYNTGSAFFKNLVLRERWNLNIAHLDGDLLLLKVFPDEGNPVSKGIIAINCKTGLVEWEKYNIAYQHAWQEGIEVVNPLLLPRKPYLLDIKTGDEITADQWSAETSSVLLPEPCDQTVIPEWLKHGEIAGHVLYLEANGKNFLAFHEKTTKKIRLRLVVYQQFTVLIDVILQEDIQKLLPEAFFMVQNHLFCIRGNNTLVSYLL